VTQLDTSDAAAETLKGGPRRRRVRMTGRGVPLPLLIPALVGLAFLLLPLIALLVRAPWRSLPSQLTSTEVWQALQLSLFSATAATAVSLVLGVPLAWVLARTEFPGRGFVRALVTAPAGAAPGGGRRGAPAGPRPQRAVVGQWLDSTFGITLPFTTTGVVVAEAFVAMPFLVISVEGTLRAADPRYEEAAQRSAPPASRRSAGSRSP
jgi:molybdate transport system permease protein